VRIALEKSQSPVQGSVLASDAYFPFPDGPELRPRAGRDRADPPGGSVRDHRGRGPWIVRARRWSSPTADISGISARCSARPESACLTDLPSIRRLEDDPTISGWAADPPSPTSHVRLQSRRHRRPWVVISGTTSVDPSGFVVGTTPYEQTVAILDKLIHELARVGLSADDVVLTRMYVTDIFPLR